MSLPSNNPPSNPPVVQTPPATSGPMGHEEMIKFLKTDEDDKPLVLQEPQPEPEPEIEKQESEEENELEEIEKELEPPEEEDELELITPVRRKEILAKYPNLFKDFPFLEKAYYREQRFTEMFPTIEDAQAAQEAKEVLDKFEADVMEGNTELLLRAVKQENPKGFAKLVDNYLPVLAKVDEQAYLHLLGNVTKHTIIAMVQEAKKSNNEPLQMAAQILNQFVFGSSDFKPPSQLAPPEQENSREKEIEAREREFIQRQFESVTSDLNTRVNNTLKNTIDANIDPKQSMTDYVRKNASREAFEMLEQLIAKDGRFQTLKDKLWEAAFRSGFSRESVDRIKSAYLSKAKTLLPAVIKKARADALKGMGKSIGDESPSKGPVPAGRPRQSVSGKTTNPKEIPRGMSTLDFLMRD